MQTNFEVIVAGAGPAGFGAALAAARTGAKTLLLERNSCSGGTAGAGLLGFWGPFDNAGRNQMDWARLRLDREGKPYTGDLNIGDKILGGIPEEIINRLKETGNAHVPKFGFIEVNVEATKFLMEEMLLEAGVEIIYQAQVIGAESHSSGVNLQVALKEGLTDFTAKVVIDSTGDGDVAAQMGAKYGQGREGDHKCQGVTLVFRIGNVKTDVLDFLPDTEVAKNFKKAADEAFANGEISFNPGNLGCLSRDPSCENTFIVNHQHTYDIDGTKSEDRTRALINGRKQIQEQVEFYRKNIPGCEDCYLVDTGFQLGIRETRRIIGDYIITAEDIVEGSKFDDAICRNANFLDIHLPKKGAKKAENKEWYEDTKALKLGDWQDIPYRALLPKGLDNIIVAGRCISGTHEAMSSYRLMPTCMGMGQAAGTAAAIAVTNNQTPREIDIPQLQEKLRKEKVII